MPLNIIFLLLLFSCFFSAGSRTRLLLKSAAIGLLFIGSLSPVADSVIASLEDRYPNYSKGNASIDYIVVLGCNHTDDSRLSALSQLHHCSLERLNEGLRIKQLHPNAQLLFSGFGGSNPIANADVVAKAALSLGLKEADILTEPFARDTEDEAQLIAPRLAGSTFVLVTSSFHMHRALSYFQAEGLQPIPAPAGKWAKQPDYETSWVVWVPHPLNLVKITLAWYEYLGLSWRQVKSLF